MRTLDIDNMSEELLSGLIKGMESLFVNYYKNSNAIVIEDKNTYTNLYTGIYEDTVMINKLPYPIRHAENLDIYTLECTDPGVRYIPGMLVGKEEKVVMTSVILGDEFTSNLLRSLLAKILNNQYDIATALLRVMQTITALNGEFKTYSFQKDSTRYNENTNTKRRRVLR